MPYEGCTNGVLDIRGTITRGRPASMMGQEFHIGLVMPNPEDFMEKLNAKINFLSNTKFDF